MQACQCNTRGKAANDIRTKRAKQSLGGWRCTKHCLRLPRQVKAAASTAATRALPRHKAHLVFKLVSDFPPLPPNAHHRNFNVF